MTSLEEVSIKDNHDSPQDSPPQPLFSSRPITKVKSQHPKGEVQSVTHEEVCYTPPQKKLLEFSNLYRNLGNMCGNRY